jgi:H+/Cl- antiporter ClcA
MGIGAMSAAMLQLPLTSVLLATVILGVDGFTVMPLVIVAVTVSYVTSVRLTPRPAAPQAGEAGSDGNHEPVPPPRQATAQADPARRSADPSG